MCFAPSTCGCWVLGAGCNPPFHLFFHNIVSLILLGVQAVWDSGDSASFAVLDGKQGNYITARNGDGRPTFSVGGVASLGGYDPFHPAFHPFPSHRACPIFSFMMVVSLESSYGGWFRFAGIFFFVGWFKTSRVFSKDAQKTPSTGRMGPCTEDPQYGTYGTMYRRPPSPSRVLSVNTMSGARVDTIMLYRGAC